MKTKIKRKLHGVLNVVLIFGILMSSIPFTPLVMKVNALANIDGDKIIETAQNYIGWSYGEVGTCTGFVTRVLNKLGIGESIVGIHPYNIDTPQSGGGSRYAPAKMYQNALAHPEDAEHIWSGYAKDVPANASLFKNGDLVIQRPEDKANYDGSGHVAFMHFFDNKIAMLGGATDYGVVDSVFGTVMTRSTTINVNGMDYIHVFRLTERVPKGEVHVQKIDKEFNVAQNEAVLDGAVYGLYARENIENTDTGGIAYTTNQEVARVTISNGKASVGNLFLGEYYWKEITAPKGYKLDTSTYNVSIVDDGSSEVIIKNSTVQDEVITGNFDLQKIMTSGEESEIVEKEEGAEFLVVAKKYVDKYGSVEEAYNHKSEFSNREYDKLVTDKNGYAKSKDLAYGSFIVKQVKGKVDTDKINEWTFTVSSENQDTLHYIINNRLFTSYLKLVKKDADTGKTITLSNTTFKIKDAETGEYLVQKVGDKKYDTWTTGEDGSVVLPLQLKAQKYILEEIKNPDGYLVMDEMEFEITNQNVYELDEDGNALTVIEVPNTAIKGQVKVEKTGEVLTGVEQDENGNYQFIYEEQKLGGMKFVIEAKEDIIDPADGSVIYKKGTIVDEIITSAEEDTYSKLLPLGEYVGYETEAPEGMVLDDTKYDITIKEDGNTPVIVKNISVQNDRQKVDITINKKDSEDETAIEGAVFNLILKKDVLLPSGEVLVKAGTVIETGKTNSKGKLSFKADLPLSYDGEIYYEVTEVKPAEGYYPNDIIIPIVSEYRGQDVEAVDNVKYVYNDAIKNYILVNKVDDKTLENIISKDFTFSLCKDENCDNVVKEYSANTEDGTALIDIRYGTWFIRETKAPEGYGLSEQVVKVELNSDGLFVDNVKVETNEDLVYSFEYQNTLLPVVQTGIDDSMSLYIIIGSLSLLGIAGVIYSLTKKKNNKKN